MVGGDGLIGSRLADWAGRVDAELLFTTRRRSARVGRLFADLANDRVEEIASAGANVVLFCAAMTNLRACENEPELSYRINVSATVGLAERLVEQGCFVVFLSSNAVFDGRTAWPQEQHAHSPTCEYGRQKASTERLLMGLPGAADHVAVVRLSKVLSPGAGMVAEFLRRLRARERCKAFEDLKISPISLRYVADALSKIASRRLPGIFHLSGAEELSYAQFAFKLAERLGAGAELIQQVCSVREGMDVVFRPTHPGLGMRRTRSLLGIDSESLDELLLEFSLDRGL